MSDTEYTLAHAVIEHFHGPDNRHGSWWLNTDELAEAFQPILDAHDAELTKRVRAEQREADALIANEHRYAYDAVRAIREASDE